MAKYIKQLNEFLRAIVVACEIMVRSLPPMRRLAMSDNARMSIQCVPMSDQISLAAFDWLDLLQDIARLMPFGFSSRNSSDWPQTAPTFRIAVGGSTQSDESGQALDCQCSAVG
jgi:hypothetical protein